MLRKFSTRTMQNATLKPDGSKVANNVVSESDIEATSNLFKQLGSCTTGETLIGNTTEAVLFGQLSYHANIEVNLFVELCFCCYATC